MKFLLTLVVVGFLTSGFNSYAQNINKIIGADDMVAVDAAGSNIPPKYKGLLDAFGLLNMGCTATHIGNGYVLTAGHCFFASEEPMKNLDCADVTVDWGIREGTSSYLTSVCEKIIIAQQDFNANDFAIIKVFPVPTAAIAPYLYTKATASDTLTMFSHPEDLPLRWSPTCGIEKVQHPDLPPGAFHHKCDTSQGSSGASILNIRSLKIVGIHDGGAINENGEMNYATYIMSSPLYESLKELGF